MIAELAICMVRYEKTKNSAYTFAYAAAMMKVARHFPSSPTLFVLAHALTFGSWI